jgi:hypothetical protein
MAVEILSIGSQEQRSSDVVVASGATVTLFLKSQNGGAVVGPLAARVQMKDSAGTYNTIGQMTELNPSCSIVSPGTYAVLRVGTGAVFGVEQG